jgi:hypothetical protein
VTEFQRSIDRQLPSLGFDTDKRSVSRMRRLLAANQGCRLRYPHFVQPCRGEEDAVSRCGLFMKLCGTADAPDKLLSSRRVFLSRGGCDPILGWARRTGARAMDYDLFRRLGRVARPLQGVSIRH